MTPAVPAEYIGRARDLRRRLGATEATVEQQVHTLLAPLSCRLRRHPAIRKEDLIDAERRWRALPDFGCCRTSVDISNPKAPLFVTLRLWPSIYKSIGWEGDHEPGISATLIQARVRGRQMAVSAYPVAVLSLHSLARRYQRAPASLCSDDTLVSEIASLALDFPTIVPEDGGAFTFPTPAGRWVGHTIESRNGEIVIAVRTFLDADAPAMAA